MAQQFFVHQYVAAVLFVAVATFLLANSAPAADEPTPSPNALDYYLSGAKLVVRNLDTAPGEVSDLDRQAELPPEQQETLLSKNQEALRRLREGFQYDCRVPAEKALDPNTFFPDFAGLRTLGQLLRLESSVKASRRDYSGAMDSLLDAMQVGADVSRGGNMIQALVGMSVMSIGRTPAIDLVDELDASQAKAAAKRVQQLTARPAHFVDVLRVEREFGRKLMQEYFQAEDWRAAVAGASLLFDDDEPDRKLVSWLKTRSQLDVSRAYEEYMDQLIARSELPYVVARRQPKIKTSPLTTYLATISSDYGFRYRDMENRFLATALALRARQAETGSYPENLPELVATYLSSVPTDPFADNQPFRYKRIGDNYLLYSIGPDGKDDGGKPAKIENGLRRPGPDSKGDIVYGITGR